MLTVVTISCQNYFNLLVGVKMDVTLKQIAELPLKERRQSGATTNYFLSKEYFAHKRRKKVMQARTLIELEIEDGRFQHHPISQQDNLKKKF